MRRPVRSQIALSAPTPSTGPARGVQGGVRGARSALPEPHPRNGPRAESTPRPGELEGAGGAPRNVRQAVPSEASTTLRPSSPATAEHPEPGRSGCADQSAVRALSPHQNVHWARQGGAGGCLRSAPGTAGTTSAERTARGEHPPPWGARGGRRCPSKRPPSVALRGKHDPATQQPGQRRRPGARSQWMRRTARLQNAPQAEPSEASTAQQPSHRRRPGARSQWMRRTARLQNAPQAVPSEASTAQQPSHRRRRGPSHMMKRPPRCARRLSLGTTQLKHSTATLQLGRCGR